jgi:hypothetical protein
VSRRKRCRSDAVADADERAAFVRDNAVALVAERDALIARLRRQVTDLLQARQALRAEVARLREAGAG